MSDEQNLHDDQTGNRAMRRVREFTGGQRSFLDGLQPSSQLSPFRHLHKLREQFIESLVNWFYSREPALLYPAAPLFLVLTLFFLVSGWGSTNADPSTRLADFRRVHQLAVQESNSELRHLSLRAMEQIEPQNASYAIQRAELFLTENDPEQALQALGPFIQPDRRGNPDARLWLLRRTLTKDSEFSLTRKEVIQQLHAVLEESRGDREAARTLARIYMMTKEWQLAERSLQQAAAVNPDLNLNLLKLQIALDRPQEVRAKTARLAVAGLQQLYNEDQRNISVITRLAEAHYLNSDSESARSLLMEKHTELASPRIARSLSQMETLIARDLMDQSASLSDICCAGLLKAVELNPLNVTAIRELIHLKQLNCVISPQRLSDALKVWSEKATATDARLDDIMVVVWLHDLRGEYLRAAELVSAQLDKQPELLRYTTQLLIKADRVPQARLLARTELIRMEEALRSEPGSVALKNQLAGAYLSLLQPRDAVELLQEKSETSASGIPENPESAELYAEALLGYFDELVGLSGRVPQLNSVAMPRIHDRQQGRMLTRLLTTAITAAGKDSRHPTVHRCLDRLCRIVSSRSPAADMASEALNALRAEGNCNLQILNILAAQALELGRYDDAVKWLGIASHASSEENPGILNNLAIALVRSQPPQPIAALERANKAIGLMPNHADLLSTRGEIFIAMNDWKNAQEDLQASLSLRSDKSRVHRMMAETLRAQGSLDEAQRHQKRAIELEKGLSGSQASL